MYASALPVPYLKLQAAHLCRDLVASDASRQAGALCRIQRAREAFRSRALSEVQASFRHSDSLDVIAFEWGFSGWRALEEHEHRGASARSPESQWKPVVQWADTVQMTLLDLIEARARNNRWGRQTVEQRIFQAVFDPGRPLPQDKSQEVLVWSVDRGYQGEILSLDTLLEEYEDRPGAMWHPWPQSGWQALESCPRDVEVGIRLEHSEGRFWYYAGTIREDGWLEAFGERQEYIYDTNFRGVEDGSHITWVPLPTPPMAEFERAGA